MTGTDATLVMECLDKEEFRERDTSVGRTAERAVPLGFLPLIVGDVGVAGLGGVFLSSDIFNISTSLPFLDFAGAGPFGRTLGGVELGAGVGEGFDISFDFFARNVLLRDGCPVSLLHPFSSRVVWAFTGGFALERLVERFRKRCELSAAGFDIEARGSGGRLRGYVEGISSSELSLFLRCLSVRVFHFELDLLDV